MNILGSLGGGAHLGLGNLTGMTLGNLNAVLIGGTATLPSKEMFLGAAFQEGYFPRQWAAGTHEQGELIYCKTNIAGFFFDAVLNVSTEHTAVVTSHPVQTGANISDHMYLEPVQITMISIHAPRMGSDSTVKAYSNDRIKWSTLREPHFLYSKNACFSPIVSMFATTSRTKNQRIRVSFGSYPGLAPTCFTLDWYRFPRL